MTKTHTLSTILTDHEVELARLIAAGKSSKEIAAELNVSTKTVETHRANIYRKIGVRKTQSLILWLISANLFSTDDERKETVTTGLLEIAKADLNRLVRAVKAIYFAAYWFPDRRVIDASGMWAELRNAAGIEPGDSRRVLGLPMPDIKVTVTGPDTVHVVTEKDGKLNAIFFDEETACAYATRNGSHKNVSAWAVHRTLETLGPRAPFLPKEGVTASELPDPERYGLDRPRAGGR